MISPDITLGVEQIFHSPFPKNLSQGEIGSTKLLNPLSKGIVKKTADISLGGAMRVLREPSSNSSSNETINRTASKALRVLALPSFTSDTSMKTNNISPNKTISVSLHTIENTEKKLVNKRKIVVSDFVKTKKPDLLPDLQNLFSQAKSSDWQTRCKAMDALLIFVRSKDFKLSPKFMETLFLGLDDSHFRVNTCAFDVISTLLEMNSPVEPFFMKTVIAVYNSYGSKSRASIFEKSEMLLFQIVISIGENAIPSILSLVTDQNLVKKLKAKNGLMLMLCSINHDFVSSYISKSTSKDNYNGFIHRF